MPQASVLTDNDIKRVFRIVERTRHAERNRLAFILSIYAGLRVGESMRRSRASADPLNSSLLTRKEPATLITARLPCCQPAPQRQHTLSSRLHCSPNQIRGD